MESAGIEGKLEVSALFAPFCGSRGEERRRIMDIGDFNRDMAYYREKLEESRKKKPDGICQGAAGKEKDGQDDWEQKMKKWDEELKRIREENRREQKRLQEERLRKKRIRKKLLEKLALKQYLARQDEIRQMNERIAIERAVGEDVYVEKPPLSKSLSAAEIAAICSEC